MPTAQDLLAKKGFSIHFISSRASVLEAVERMNQLHVGALVVMDDGHLKGMFTERDILRRVIGRHHDPAGVTVGQVMTVNVICCSPKTELEELSSMMKDHRIRHLPVRDHDDDLLGLISIGDVNAMHASTQAATLNYLSEYVYGRA
jgi:CBS domain-containing protein